MIPRLDAPIILVHGLFGFDKVQVGSVTIANYFPGIVEALQTAGNRVFVPSLSPTAGIIDRAKQLKDFIRKSCAYDKVHLIAHSMGGLDARYMIAHLDMASQVATLTTLGTPHRGSSFADWAISKVEWLVKPALAVLNLPHQAFYDLTTVRCRAFNESTPQVPGVRYFSVAAEHDAAGVSPEWRLSHAIVNSVEGPNDGVVSLASANFGEACDIWPGDHFSLVNWSPLRAKPADTLARWQTLIERLTFPKISA
jgi:triacylglycerol lipase